MFAGIFLVGLVCIVGKATTAADSVCQWEYTDPKTSLKTRYDLSPLRNLQVDYSAEDQYFEYVVNFCGPTVRKNAQMRGNLLERKVFDFEAELNKLQRNLNRNVTNRVFGENCPKTASVCSYWNDDGAYYSSYGSFDDAPGPSWALHDEEDPEGGVMVSLNNGEATCMMGRREKTNLHFICDRSKTTASKTLDVHENFKLCVLDFRIFSAFACPVKNVPSNGDDSSSLNGGSIFVIVFFALFGGYCFLGALWLHFRKHQRGLDRIPHRTFWCTSLPNCIVHSVSTCYSKICRRSSSTPSSFENLSSISDV